MAASVSENLMKQLLRKVFSLYFDFSETNSRFRTQMLKLSPAPCSNLIYLCYFCFIQD